MTGKFKVSKVIEINDLREGMEIGESDLTIKNNEKVVQFDYYKDEENEDGKYVAKPGTYNLGYKGNSLALNPLELRNKYLLSSYDNTALIKKEADSFFDNLHKYEAIRAEKKRAVLLYSPPGFGKTSAISEVMSNYRKQDDKTICINWPTSEVESYNANRFLASIDYKKNSCSRLILVIEDIGGGEMEDHGGGRGVDSSLLNLLDGIDDVFPIPTFIIATTNHPGSLLDALADRPGRFDEYIELEAPNLQQRIDLIKFMADRDVTEDEKKALEKAENFSPAHLSEIVKRSFLKDMTYEQVIDDLLTHKKKVQDRFDKAKEKEKNGIGFHGRR